MRSTALDIDADAVAARPKAVDSASRAARICHALPAHGGTAGTVQPQGDGQSWVPPHAVVRTPVLGFADLTVCAFRTTDGGSRGPAGQAAERGAGVEVRAAGHVLPLLQGETSPVTHLHCASCVVNFSCISVKLAH